MLRRLLKPARSPVQRTEASVAAGDERAHPTFLRACQCPLVVRFRGLNVRWLGACGGNLSPQSKGPCLDAGLAVFASQGQGPFGRLKRLVKLPSTCKRLASVKSHDRKEYPHPHRSDGGERLVEQRETGTRVSRQGVRIAELPGHERDQKGHFALPGQREATLRPLDRCRGRASHALEVGEMPVGEDGAVRMIELLADPDGFVAMLEAFGEVTLLGERAGKPGPPEHAGKPRHAEAIAILVASEPRDDAP